MKLLIALSLFLIPVSLWADIDCKGRDLSGVYGIPRDGDELILKKQINRTSSSDEEQNQYVTVESIEYEEGPCDKNREDKGPAKSICKKLIEFSVYNPPNHLFIASGTKISLGRIQNDKRYLRLLKDDSPDLTYGKPQISCYEHRTAPNGTSRIKRVCRDEDFKQLFVNKTLEQCQHRARAKQQKPSTQPRQRVR